MSRLSKPLHIETLEDRSVPATFSYAAGTLTVIPDENTTTTIKASLNAPPGYLNVTDGNTLFDSLTNQQPVMNVVVNLSSRSAGGVVLDNNAVIVGNLTVKGAKTTSNLQISGDVGKDVLFQASPGLSENGFALQQFATIGRNATLNMGDATSLVFLNGGNVGGNFTLNSGKGLDGVYLTGFGSVGIGGNATFNMGANDGGIVSAGNGILKVGKNLTINALGGQDTVDLTQGGMFTTLDVGGNTTLNLGNGISTLGFAGGFVGGNFSVKTGLGDDTIYLTADSDLDVGGSVAFNLGAGYNRVISTGSNDFNIGKNFTLSTTTGNDEFDLVTGTTTRLKVGGNATITMGNAGIKNVFHTAAIDVGGKLAITTGTGEDNIQMDGPSSISGTTSIITGNGPNTVTIFGGSFGGMNYKGGQNWDAFKLDQATIYGNSSFDLGTNSTIFAQRLDVGTNDFVPVTFYGNVRVKGLAGQNEVAIARTNIIGNLDVLFGAASDLLNLDDTNIGGKANFAMGAGADFLHIDNQTADNYGVLGGITTFGGAVKIDGGKGNDNVYLSNVGGDMIRFGSMLTLIGGEGQDTYGNTVFNEFLAAGNKALTNETVNGVAIPA